MTLLTDVPLQVHQIRSDLQKIERLVHELSARLDSAFPGADLSRHYSEHEQSADRRRKRHLFWGSMWEKSIFGATMGITFLVGLILIAVLRPGIFR
jgi:hypothetical protein